MANLLPLDAFDVTVIDKSEYHIFQPGALFVAFRYDPVEKYKRPMREVLKKGINFVHDEVTRINLDERLVETKGGKKFEYDFFWWFLRGFILTMTSSRVTENS